MNPTMNPTMNPIRVRSDAEMAVQSRTRAALALFPKARGEVLALFFGAQGGAFYLREVVERTGLGLGSVQRELERLVDGGILRRWTEGRHVYFEADVSCPVFEELRGIATKALRGPGARTRRAARR